MSNRGTNPSTSAARGRGSARGSRPARNTRNTVSLVTAGHQEFTQGTSPGLPAGAFTLVISGTSVQQMTVHRPIGHHDLTAEDWVITPVEEVSQLLERREDPVTPAILARRETNKIANAIVAGLITRIDGKIRYPGEQAVDRDTALAAAKAAASEGLEKGRNPSTAQIIARLPENIQGYENALQEYLRSDAVRERAANAFPLVQYRTISGPVADRPQVAIPYLKGMSPARARDEIIRRVFGRAQPIDQGPTAAPAQGL